MEIPFCFHCNSEKSSSSKFSTEDWEKNWIIKTLQFYNTPYKIQFSKWSIKRFHFETVRMSLFSFKVKLQWNWHEFAKHLSFDWMAFFKGKMVLSKFSFKPTIVPCLNTTQFWFHINLSAPNTGLGKKSRLLKFTCKEVQPLPPYLWGEKNKTHRLAGLRDCMWSHRSEGKVCHSAVWDSWQVFFNCSRH